MPRPCGSGFGPGCGGVSNAGVSFPVGGGCPPASQLGIGQVAEMRFAKIPNFDLIAAAVASGCTAGDICGGDIPFTFVTSPASTSGTALTGSAFSEVTLNPISSPSFQTSANGKLRYNGPTANFVVTFEVTITLASTTASFFGSTNLAFISVFLCKNDLVIQSSAETASLVPACTGGTTALTEALHTFSGQALVQLRAGDELEVCVADLFNGGNGSFVPASPTDSVCISQFSLIAQQAP